MNRSSFLLINLLCLITACSNTPPIDEQVVANSPTHPKVTQRPAPDNERVEPGDHKFRPRRSNVVETVQVPSGSLFNARRSIGLYQPSNHYKVGDMILVEIKETSSANKSVNYKTKKKDHFELQPVTFNAGRISVGDDDLNAEYEQEKDFDSSAQTKQKNSLKGGITVFVTEVLKNGNLIVAGEKWITISTGEEYIRFSGEIRVSEVSLDHTISSVRVGNARIEYGGDGGMYENEEASLLGKLFGIFD